MPSAHITSPLKAVPLAVLLAMSPVTVQNVQAAKPNQTVTAIAEAPQKVIYQRTYKTHHGYNLTIKAINTKDNSTNFDKIVLKSGEFEYDVKDVYDSNMYLLSVNGVKEGPLNFYEVKAFDKTEGQMTSFLDPNVAGYVAALVQTPNNASKIKEIKNKTYNLVILSDKEDPGLMFASERQMKKIPWNPVTEDKYYGREITSKRLIVNGTHGKYTLRFYDVDKNMNTAENLTVQKEGEDELYVHGIFNIKASLFSMDNEIDLGLIKAISFYDGISVNFGVDTIMDDILADKIIELIKKDPSLYHSIYVTNNSSDIVLDGLKK